MNLMIVALVLLFIGLILSYSVMILFMSRIRDYDSTLGTVDQGEFPFITVIIAVRNEEQTIITCINSIVHQDYPADRFEILISDDHSEDGTITVVREFASANTGISVKTLSAGSEEMDGQGKKAAILRAVFEAKGEWILTTDADTVRGPGWIKAMVLASRIPDARMVAGPVFLNPGAGLFTRIQSVEFMGVMGLTMGSVNRGYPLMANGANLLFRKNAFFHAGGYRDNMKFSSGDDQFLLASFVRNFGEEAVRFACNGDAMVTTYPETTLMGFLNQRMRWASKSRGYRDSAVLIAGMITLMAPVSIWGSVSISIMEPRMFWFPLSLFLVKMAVDFPLVSRMCRFFRRPDLRKAFIPAQIFQLIYVPIIGLVSWVLPYSWKGRRRRA